MSALHPIVDMLGGIVGPHIEVVLHDLTQPETSVVALANGHVSDRGLGASILGGLKNDKAFIDATEQLSVRGEAVHSVMASYATVTRSGRELKSATVLFRDANGDLYAALCVNADLSHFQMAHSFLTKLLHPQPQSGPADAVLPDMDVLMREIISDAVRLHGKPVSMMNKKEKTLAVKNMLQRGLFIVKGGVERAAAALEVSRYTVYNYLEALRQEDDHDAG
ncbi:helix-turn-helix transcriptional regulator [Janthinobacterium agaricidamnosum]|uniref:Sensory box protein n=1 Tax=Janthinobacterium agaricidamnosum NBRC 102515 = DSM 9628 TaxID=1349767 RepID=W0V3E0_9BURK|nr:PAS domain-containing protein [Janthinobacterium agaricidamnosum]CDG82386.1 sensory box protein [Janthinobacterium agaricidamnosum NBRC 102515 = DSM 9628]